MLGLVTLRNILYFNCKFILVNNIIVIVSSNVNCNYCMTSSLSGQDEPNRTQVGKMELSCPLETTRCIPLERFT